MNDSIICGDVPEVLAGLPDGFVLGTTVRQYGRAAIPSAIIRPRDLAEKRLRQKVLL